MMAQAVAKLAQVMARFTQCENAWDHAPYVAREFGFNAQQAQEMVARYLAGRKGEEYAPYVGEWL